MPDGLNLQLGADGIQLTVAILGPDEFCREVMADALNEHSGIRLKEFPAYPKRDDLGALAKQYQAILVDVDSDPDLAYDLIDTICSSGRAYVMAYSGNADTKTAIRFMRAGVREFFTLPLDYAELNGALTRAANHRPPARDQSKEPAKLIVFMGAKGGCGVTTLGANFAVALSQEAVGDTLLVDFGLPIGDVAINLGLSTEFSYRHALQNADRLDGAMLSTLVAKHSSGLWVLAAPTDLPDSQPPIEAIDKLIAVMRENYQYVVVDIGSRVDLMGSALFQPASIVYLVTQVGITEMRNTNRLMLKHFTRREENLQLIINRYKSSDAVFDDSQIAKALTRTPDWKVPDDYTTARRTRNTATPLALADSPIAQALREMAQAVSGVAPESDKKKGLFSIFR
jgi:pilus assembly protein CpaE